MARRAPALLVHDFAFRGVARRDHRCPSGHEAAHVGGQLPGAARTIGTPVARHQVGDALVDDAEQTRYHRWPAPGRARAGRDHIRRCRRCRGKAHIGRRTARLPAARSVGSASVSGRVAISNGCATAVSVVPTISAAPSSPARAMCPAAMPSPSGAHCSIHRFDCSGRRVVPFFVPHRYTPKAADSNRICGLLALD